MAIHAKFIGIFILILISTKLSFR